VTSTLFRRGGRIGLLVFAVLTLVTFALAWVRVTDGSSFIGFDLHNINDYVPDSSNPLTQLFLEVAPLPAYVAVLLAPTVAVRARWARIVGVVLAALATALAAIVAIGLYSEIEDSWPADRVHRYQAYGVVMGLVAVVLLAATVLLAVNRRGAYHGVVAALLLGFAAFHLGNVAVLAGRATDAVSVTVVPWLTGVAYLLAGLCVVVAAVGYARSAADA
jgi:hypothetical protein